MAYLDSRRQMGIRRQETVTRPDSPGEDARLDGPDEHPPAALRPARTTKPKKGG